MKLAYTRESKDKISRINIPGPPLTRERWEGRGGVGRGKKWEIKVEKGDEGMKGKILKA